MFPDEQAAREWFEAQIWPSQRCCGHCGSVNTHDAKHKTMPYRCRDCRKYFSVKTGTALAASNVPLRKWVFAIYLELTNLKGVSSMKLHRDLGVTQKTAWFMLHRIREAWAVTDIEPFARPVEADETYIGGKSRNMHAAPDAKVFTDGHKSYNTLNRDHEIVAHSVGEYVRGMAHTNGIESFWSMLKRGYQSVYHNLSDKHLHRYVAEYAGRHNFRDAGTVEQMRATVRGLVGQRLRCTELVA